MLACPGTPPWAPVKRVFVTSATYMGNLGGLEGADATCQAHADAAGLDGEFKAWLSTAVESAAERLTQATVPYARVDDVQVAANWNDLVDGLLAAPISLDENGTPYTINRVWTGTAPNGSHLPPDCQGWHADQAATEQPSATQGKNGVPNETGEAWTGFDAAGCQGRFPIYCVEQ
jgi:hypothetical protein